MDVRMFTVGPVQENTFILRRDGSDRALIVDPGEEAPKLLAAAKAEHRQRLASEKYESLLEPGQKPPLDYRKRARER